MIRKPVLAVFCALLCLLPLSFSSAVSAMNNSFPSAFYVTFQGYVQSSSSNDDPRLWVQFLNGTSYSPKTTLFTFSMEELAEGEHIVKFMLTFDDFYDEISVPATVSNGRVYIDSTETIFVVDPNSLIDDNTLQLYQTETLALSGTVFTEGRPTTLIEDYHIVSKIVRTSYQQTNSSGLFIGSPYLWFDQKTGVLTRASAQISDILLNKLGIEFIFGGRFELLDYSKNLNFTLVHINTPFWEFVIIPLFAILFVLVVFLAYRSSKKKKSGRRKTTPAKFLKIHFANASKEEGARYGF